jgi:hypothetical protein
MMPSPLRLSLIFLGVIFLCRVTQAADKCMVSDFRVVAQNEVHLYCKVRVQLATNRDVTIYQLDADSQRITTIKGELAPTSQSHWYKVKLDSALATGSQYQIKDMSNPEARAFDLYTFSTKPSGKLQVVDSPSCEAGHLLILQSNVALNPNSLSSASLAVTYDGTQPTTLNPSNNAVQDDLLIGQATGCAFFGAKAGQTVVLTLSGSMDILSGSIRAKGSYAAPSPPLTQSAATYYAKFDGQAGVGQKPGYILEATAAPKLANLGGQYYFLFNGNADLGFGSSDTAKISDMIKLGFGVTRYYSRSRIEFEPLLQYETDRHGSHRNLLFDGEAQYFGKNWRRSIAQRNYDEYARRVLAGGNDAPKDPKEVNVYHSGLLFETHLGTELGGALSSDTVKSSDKKTSVMLPSYDIARIKPSVNATAEYRQVSLTATVTPRYLFTHENVTREVTIPNPASATSTIQSIYLSRTTGLRTLGNLTFLWALDAPGHLSWSVTYKVGSEPPNFNHVNQVETGLVLIY